MMFLSIFIGLLAIAAIVRYFFRSKYTIKEFGLGVGILFTVICIGYLIASHAQTADVQVLSGKVTEKKKVKVFCRHSYSCNCYTTCSGGKNMTCSTHCQTCYEHLYDNDWDVISSIGTITIDTIDRQGLREPPRWTQVYTNEPVSVTNSYTNWLKAVPESVFRRTTEEKLPTYPDKIYDYYRIDRVVLDGIDMPDDEFKAMNNKISESLIDLAKLKQVNLVIVLTNRTSQFSQELRAGWLNGKKNDMVVVIGTTTYPEIAWVDVFGWSANDLANIKTRDDIREHGKIDDSIVGLITANISQYWSRKPMEEYEYLKDEIELSNTSIVILVIIGLMTIVGSTIIFTREDVL